MSDATAWAPCSWLELQAALDRREFSHYSQKPPEFLLSPAPKFGAEWAKSLRGSKSGAWAEILMIFQWSFLNRECGSSIPAWSATHSSVLPGFPRDRRMGRKSRLFTHSLWSPDSRSAALEGNSPKVSGRFRRYSRFGETIAGDGFDQDYRPTLALSFSPSTGSRRHGIGNLSLGLPHDHGTLPRPVLRPRVDEIENLSPALPREEGRRFRTLIRFRAKAYQ